METERKITWSSNPLIVVVCLFATLGGLLFGYDQGVVSGILTMENFGYHFPRIYLDAGYKGWFVSTFLLCSWLGSLINGPIADYVGRKRSIMLACIVFCIGSAFQTAALSDAMIFAGRGVAGVSVGMLTMVVPMYIAEVAPAQLRGGLVVLQQLSITIGILVSYWIDYGCNYIGGTRCDPDTPYSGGTSDSPKFDPRSDVGPDGCTGQSTAAWRIPLGLQIFPAIVLFGAMFVLPYSPRWLVSKNRDDEAIRALATLRRLPIDNEEIHDEYALIKADVLFEKTALPEHLKHLSGPARFFGEYWNILTTWSHFKRVFIGSAVMFFQQFSGCNALIYYAPTIFGQLGLDSNTTSLLATGVYGIVNCLSTVPAIFLIDRMGRRKLLMMGAAGTVVSLVIVGAIVAHYGDDLSKHKAAGWAGIAFIYIYDINFSYSWAPISWVLPSEIFSLRIRSKGIAITTSSAWMNNFIIGLVSPKMLENITWGTYIIFAAFMFLALLFAIFVIPETRNRSLEEMDEVFGDTAATQDKERLAALADEIGHKSPDDDSVKQVVHHVETEV